MTHSPTPWRVNYTEIHGKRYGPPALRSAFVDRDVEEYRAIRTGSGGARSYSRDLFRFDGLDDDDANAAFIVRAVNNHDELVEALEYAKIFIENGIEFGFIHMPDKGDPAHDTLPMILAVLAAIKEPKP